MFEFQPVIIDHCASPPGRLDVSHSALAPARRITSMSKIRIFGRTAEGTAVAMTVHNFHPTLYISTPQIVDPSELGEWATTTARQLNRALQGEPPRQATTKVVHQGASLERPLVLSVTLVAGRHFYYYSASPRPFLQIALVHASDVKRAAEFFHATTPYDVLEAHIPFDLQFMIAANIFGMGSVAIADGHVEHHRRAEREAGALEISISFADILNQTLVAQSLAARREGASGHFSRSPMMPSVVAMLADLGLGPSAGSPLCPSADAGEMSAATREALPLDAYSKFEGNVRAQYAKVDLADSIQLAAVASLLQPAFHADRDVPGCNSSLQRRAPTDGAQGALPASVPSHSPFTEALADSPFGGGRANLALSRSVSPTKDDGGNENSQEYSLPGDFFTQSLPTASPPYSKEGPAIAEAILSGIASDTIPQTPASAPMGRGGTLLQSHPPTASELLQSMHLYRLPRHVHTKPFYSSARDQSAAYRAPATGRSIPPLPTRAAFALSLFHPSDEHVDEHFDRDASAGPSIRRRKRYTFAAEPPLNFEEAKRWCAIQDARPKSSSSSDGDSIEGLSQIEAPPPKEGPLPAFKVVEAARGGKRDALLILAAEVFGQCRANLNADPRQDALKCIFYCLHSSFAQPPLYKSGVFKIPPQHNLDEGQGASATLLREETCGFAMHTCTDESHLLRSWVTFVTDADPDIICGFDTETASWGYISARYTAVIGMHYNACPFCLPNTASLHLTGRSLAEDLGRPKMAREELRGGRGDASETGSDGLGAQGSEAGWRTKRRGGLQIFGRIVLNVWRVMRHELALPHHDFEYLSSRILQRHLPLHPPQHLSRWYSTRKGFPNLQRYLASRTRGAIELLLRTETIRKSCEFARLFGVSLQAVLARGSQFKVESLMTRLARLENFLMLTPSKAAIVSMRAFEAVPLVIEPTSRYYVDPVIVLDFQSLYPSIMIAYNLCFSTCLGSITQAFPKALGAATVPSPSAHGAALHRLAAEQLVSVTPNRVAFVKKAVREGTLGRMLSELLEARIAVKSLLARCSATDDSLRGTLEARQVGLKYIATMVFGYTAASYAGRMPSVDIADSIMQVGRGTLERAVRLIEATSRWDAHVVYGDTDSVFVHVPGRSVAEALAIGREIAEAVTGDNPRPIELRLEKVYSPCVILSKKRYFGLKHDAAPKSSPDAPAPPLFDAKGIEVVRRDSCPIVSKIFEKSTGYIILLFATHLLC